MRNVVLVCVLLAALTTAVFWQTTGFDFVNFDDPLHLPDHLEVQDGLSAPGIWWAFSENFGGNYIPVTALTFLADFQAHRLDPGGYHQTNVILHVANVLLLFVFLFRTTAGLGPSALVAALFAIHPLHVESVAWISARKDLVSTFFWLTALIVYASYARRPRIAPYVLTLGLLVLGLLSKSMLVTFPFALLLLDIWPLRRIDLSGPGGADKWRVARKLVLEKIPFLIPVAGVSVATAVLQHKAGAMAPIAALGVPDRIANAFISYVAYLGKALWPVDLIVVYPHRTLELLSLQVLAAVALLSAITIVVVLARTRAPYLIVGWLWYVGTLVPVIGLVQVGNQAMADRYTYVPLIGIFIAVAWGVDDLTRLRPRIRLMAVAMAMGVVAALSIVSTRQVAHWENSIELFEHTIRVNPQNRTALTNLGAAYLKGERTDEAIAVIEVAIKLDPGSLANHQNLGNA